ncbi:ArdC-like ssDNA-binding domain-containing protein [Agromyces italicus]|uniref:ArdC-like ssDNA-binding domain-containing protein n=1 Tax=Agromyces italicus TaxID=279572 RepID=UPI0003F79613|nr:ImmA/IrrE family metallo-endopeptidase [Agromyces italicus]
MPSKPQSQAEREAKVAELHEQLVASVDALVSGDEWKRALEFAARFRARSFNNTLLIWVQHAAAFERGTVSAPTPTYVAGFKQWQLLGHRVLAGQRGYAILAPLTARFATAQLADPSAWRRLGRAERPRAGEVVQSRMIGVRPAYVWDVSQTDGPPLLDPPAPKLLSGAAPAGLWDGLADLVRRERYSVWTVFSAAAIGGANGRTDFTDQRVSIRSDMDPAARVKTLAHELAHILMHDPEVAVTHRGIGEVEAESVALMIGAAHGMDTSDYTIPYVAGWATSVASKTPAEVVQASGERVRRTSVSILDQLMTEQLGAGDPPGLEQAQASQRSVGSAGTTRPPNRPAQRVGSQGL